MKFKLKSSTTPNKRPTNLLDGEVAINLVEKKLYFGHNNTVYEIEPSMCASAAELKNPFQLTVGRTTKPITGGGDVTFSLNEVLPTATDGVSLLYNNNSWATVTFPTPMSVQEAVTGDTVAEKTISPNTFKTSLLQTVTSNTTNTFERDWELVGGNDSAFVQMLTDENISHLSTEPGTHEAEFQFHYTEEWKRWVGTGHLGVALRAIQNPHIGTSGAGIIIGPYDPFTNGNNIIPEFWGKNTDGVWRNWLSNVGVSPRLVEGEHYRVVVNYTIKDIRQREGDAWIRYSLFRRIDGTLQRQTQWELVYDSGAIDNPNITNKDAVDGAHNVTTFWISSNSDPKGPFFTNFKTYWRRIPDQRVTSILPITHIAANHYKSWKVVKETDTSIRILPYKSNIFSYPLNAGANSIIGNSLTVNLTGLNSDVIYYLVPDGKDEYGMLKVKPTSSVTPHWSKTFGWIIGNDGTANVVDKAIPILGAFVLEGGILHDSATKRHLISFANQNPRTIYVRNVGTTQISTGTTLASCSYISMGNAGGMMGDYQPIDYSYNVCVSSAANQELGSYIQLYDGLDAVYQTSVRRVFTHPTEANANTYLSVNDRIIESPVSHPNKTSLLLHATKYSSGSINAVDGMCTLQVTLNDLN